MMQCLFKLDLLSFANKCAVIQYNFFFVVMKRTLIMSKIIKYIMYLKSGVISLD